MELVNTSFGAKKWVGLITRERGRGERQEGCFPIFVVDVCDW